MNTLRYLWEKLHSNLWFIPTLIVTGAVTFALKLVDLESVITRERLLRNWLGSLGIGGTDGARALLSTIVGSMITIAGVTFSITIVALVLASNQYSPRILRNFRRDRIN